jgi:two-component system chemotaxis response regulator CheB
MVDKIIKVMVVDDSSFIRAALTKIINSGRAMEVIGTASNGREALERIPLLKPDVITLDVEMPEMDGITALAEIMRKHPIPVIMCSSLTKRQADISLKCLDLGAVDLIAKPDEVGDESLNQIKYQIYQKIRAADGAHVSARKPGVETITNSISNVVNPIIDKVASIIPNQSPRRSGTVNRVVAIGTSTGGPRALLEVLQLLPANLDAAVVVVQHMPAQFTAAMAQRFDNICPIAVKEAAEGDCLENGLVLVAPGGYHMHVNKEKKIYLTNDPPILGVRPAVDPMFEDVAEIFGRNCLGVVLTGMGRDGTYGSSMIKELNGTVYVQDEASCVVYGMPRSVLEAKMSDKTVILTEMAEAIIEWVKNMGRS